MSAAIPQPLLLVFPFGYLSHYMRCLTLAHHLKPYFRILFAEEELYNEHVRAAGFGTFPCASFRTDQVLDQARSFDFSWLSGPSLHPVFRAQAAVLKELQPAAVLGDAHPTLNMAAAHAGIPFISLINGYMSRHYALVRKLSRRHFAHQWVGQLPPALANRLTAIGESLAMRQVHRPFRQLRKQYGLPVRNTYLDELAGDLNLICDLPDLFPQQQQLPDNYLVIGPLLQDSADGPLPQLLPPLPGQKTILVTMGSTGNWAAASFLNDPLFARYRIIAVAAPTSVLHAPHIHHTGFIRLADLMVQTDLVICHGGNGTIYEALQYGVPVLALTSHFEQEWNMQALERVGAGQSLDGITELQTLAGLVTDWAGRKETQPLTRLSTAIRDSLQALPQSAATLARWLKA